jgi:D-alanyl-D-alanine carboxypeptidase/D-alanyl-D-alanine-endopeptidase (penicillin-binding protein 4)
VIAIQRGDGEQMDLVLRGTVPVGILGVSYRRRVERPLPYAAHAMVEALRRAGIHAAGRVRIGETPGDAPVLVLRRSAAMADVISEMGKQSDNFVAEMVLKVLGAERAAPGTSAAGAEVLQEVLAEAGVAAGEATIVNGSGLFHGNRIATSHLTRLLRHVYNEPAVRPEYLAHLAVGGADGTLHSRLEDLPHAGIVRAKTGTLADAIALSGYVLGPEPDQVLAFSFLANGVRGRTGEARRAGDDIARALAQHLWHQ